MIGGRRWFAGVCLVTLAPGLATGAALSKGTASTIESTRNQVARVECAAGSNLRLRRFEDRSAQLFCGRRLIVRISVPG